MQTLEITIQDLVDRRYALLQQIDELKRQDDDLVHEIACKLLEAGEKQAYGSNGIGYALTSTTKYDFGKAAYRYLEEKGLIAHFTPAPKITKTKLDSLIKEGDLTYGDMAEIEKYMTIEQSPYSLRKVAAKDAGVA